MLRPHLSAFPRFPAVIAMVSINWLLIGYSCRQCLPLGVTVKASAANPTNPLEARPPLMARIGNHDPVM